MNLGGREVVHVARQHRVVVGTFDWRGKATEQRRRRSNGRKRLRIWNLKCENMTEEFCKELENAKMTAGGEWGSE